VVLEEKSADNRWETQSTGPPVVEQEDDAVVASHIEEGIDS
jgi:hypothetical protein